MTWGAPCSMEHRSKYHPKAEKIHVQYVPVMISIVGTVMLRQAFLDTRHFRMEAPQCLVQPVLSVAAHHDIRMLQLTIVPLEELV